MRIAYIAAGAAGMLCGSCIHDNTLAAAMMRQGHEVTLMPTYTPIRTDEEDVSVNRVFFGGMNVYLRLKSRLFRRAPRFIHNLLDSPALLNWISRFSSSTNAQDLGELTVSTLKGEEGCQKPELEKLVDWLLIEPKPEIVQLTNSMYVGFARLIKERTGVPVLCAVQGEDIFLEDLVEPHRSKAAELIQKRAQDVDGFIAPCDYYADYMSKLLNAPREKFHVVPLGIHMEGHGEGERPSDGGPFTIAYLARMCPEKGFHLLVEAFLSMAEKPGGSELKLKAAGYLGKRDEPYFQNQVERIERAGMSASFEWHGEATRPEKIRLLRSAHALCVPAVYRDPKGLYALEAMANGTPAAVPRHGAFPEMIGAAGGGVLFEPNSSEAVEEALTRLRNSPEEREELGRQGAESVREMFNDEAMAQATVAVYEKYVDA